ncbi:fatty acid-binding protein, liver-type [Hyalella azteca]|uniref:Fatty acid-binding protein, liver-type n=1 Tax=Hyalella azteca TaxID=294128 RepID=A0A8B7N8P8_HYAAZ|nr:fatty acid-binding protein, liver-type [Hyalella azteca]
MSLSGSYTHCRDENFEEFLKAAGVNDSMIRKMCPSTPTLEMQETTSGVTITYGHGGDTYTNVVTYGQESLVDVAGFKYYVKASKTPNGYEGTYRLENKTGTSSAELIGDTLTRTMTLDGVVSKRIFTKQ